MLHTDAYCGNEISEFSVFLSADQLSPSQLAQEFELYNSPDFDTGTGHSCHHCNLINRHGCGK